MVQLSQMLALASASLLALFAYPLLRFVESGEPAWLLMALGIVATDLLTRLMKWLSCTPLFTSALGSGIAAFRRPSRTAACDLLSRLPHKTLSHSGQDRPGFPSGHVADTAFFFTYLSLLSSTPRRMRTQIRAFGVLAVCAMGAVRISLGCHSLLQVCAGALVGIVFALAFFRIFRI